MTPIEAEILGLEALSWLAGETGPLERFLKASGVDGATLRQQAGSLELSISILDFLLENEDLLLLFCDVTATNPRRIQAARLALGT